MKLRVYKSKKKEIEKAVNLYNLAVECGRSSWSSGTLTALKRGAEIEGGYVVKHKKEIMGWGCALNQGEIHIYLLPHARKYGAASKMVRRARKDFKDHVFCPWSQETLAFFNKRKAKITKKHMWN